MVAWDSGEWWFEYGCRPTITGTYFPTTNIFLSLLNSTREIMSKIYNYQTGNWVQVSFACRAIALSLSYTSIYTWQYWPLTLSPQLTDVFNSEAVCEASVSDVHLRQLSWSTDWKQMGRSYYGFRWTVFEAFSFNRT